MSRQHKSKNLDDRLAISAIFLLAFFFCFPAVASADNSSIEQDAAQFVTKFWAGWSQDNEHAIPFVQSVSSTSIVFFGKTTSLSNYIKIQTAFAERWPIREYTLQPSSLVINCDHTALTCNVSGVVNWIDDSPARHAHSVGSANFELSLQQQAATAPEEFQVTGQSGSVKSRTLTVDQPDQTTATKSEPPENGQAGQTTTTPLPHAPDGAVRTAWYYVDMTVGDAGLGKCTPEDSLLSETGTNPNMAYSKFAEFDPAATEKNFNDDAGNQVGIEIDVTFPGAQGPSILIFTPSLGVCQSIIAEVKNDIHNFVSHFLNSQPSVQGQ